MKIFWTNLAFEMFKIDKFYEGANYQLHKQYADDLKLKVLNPGFDVSKWNLTNKCITEAYANFPFGMWISKYKRAIKSGDRLHFRVVCEGKERQVRIFLGDPVTLCEITSKNSNSFGYTKRNPKDQWNARVAAMESLKNALNSFGYEKESREIIYRKLLAKYPELKG